MPRTSSQTLYYWQADVGMFDDPKIVDLNDEYGPLGECIFFRVLDYIARTDGYFAQLNDALTVYLYRSVGSKWVKSKRIISEVIQFCGVCGLFDVNLLTQNVITSQGIQRRWLYAKKKDRARGFSTAKYWLLGDEPIHGKPREKNDSCDNNADNCNNKTDYCNNNSPYKKRQENIPPISPKGGGEGWKDRFFTAYPKLKEMAKLNDEGVDYEQLYKRFEQSEYLRSRYSAKYVLENYKEIIAGTYTDETSKYSFAKAREEWYRERRDRAEEVADKNRHQADEHCGDEMRDVKRLEITLAKAESEGMTECVKANVFALASARERLERSLASIGLTENDLKPQYNCKKCNDTGYLPNGKPCDCYEE